MNDRMTSYMRITINFKALPMQTVAVCDIFKS